ncbi:MAG: imelysin family protein [Gammaproteobacteria bacterium]
MKSLIQVHLFIIARLIVVAIGISLISACNSQRENDNPAAGSAASLNIALKNSIEQSILPGITDFKTETELLQTQVSSFCNAVNQSSLINLQNRWKTLSSQWSRIVIYNIGPVNDDLIFPKVIFIESMRQRGTDYSDTVRAELANILSDSTVLDQNYFDNLTFTKVGILALEILIFEDSNGIHSTELTDIVNDYQSNSRKCEYLNGISQLLHRHASYIQNGWETEHLDTNKAFKNILIDGELEDGSESVPKLITAIQEHLDYLKKRKLEVILDAQIANYFYQNVIATLDEIETLLQGQDDEIYSFYDHMSGGGFDDVIELINTNINLARLAANNQSRSELTSAIGILDGNFKREVPDSLNVILGINFSDGD